ncbi:acyltransferase [Acidobacteria bacterium AB60]|nr:acyltransferase [Acidobacteria bacterium AB60]
MSSTAIAAQSPTGTSPDERAFYPALDGFRAVAFLAVFFHHYMDLPWGWAGVDLFFVLSGFLITGTLFDSRDRAHRFRNFYVRRTLRIFPLYYGVMLTLLVTLPLLHWQMTYGWLVWPTYIGNFARYLHPYQDFTPFQRLADFQPIGNLHGLHIPLALGHFWSLCVEEQFYLIWPCVVFTVRDRSKLIWICALSLPTCLILRLLCQHFLPEWIIANNVLNRATPLRLDALLMGGLVALVLRGPQGHRLLRVGRSSYALALAAFVLAVIAIPSGHIFRTPYPYPEWTLTFGLPVLDLLGALIIIAAVQPSSFLNRILNISPLRWLGRISYGAYVLHEIPHPILKWLGGRISNSHGAETTAALALAFTLITAWLSFRYYESKFLKLKDRFTIR